MDLCPNPNCAQYRLQHRNMTIRKLELEKELEKYRKSQSGNGSPDERRPSAIDSETGEKGMVMPDGEIITPSKLALRMQISTNSLQMLQLSEKANRQLFEENTGLKQKNEHLNTEVRRLERILSGFEKARRYEPLNDERHKETLQINEQLADQVEQLEYKLHVMQEENGVLKRYQRRQSSTASRVVINDEERDSISSYITSDGRVPPNCPCKGEECANYDLHVVMSSNPAEAFSNHMLKYHKVSRRLRWHVFGLTRPRSAYIASESYLDRNICTSKSAT